MSSARNCSGCGAELPADAPEGLCPHCLVKRGLEESATLPDAEPRSGSDDTEIANQKTHIGNSSNPFLRYFGDYELLEEIARELDMDIDAVYARRSEMNRKFAAAARQIAKPEK